VKKWKNGVLEWWSVGMMETGKPIEWRNEVMAECGE
jgi:hypothetical protein